MLRAYGPLHTDRWGPTTTRSPIAGEQLALAGLLAAASLHMGFQLTVTALVYPVLARTQADQWTVAHARHSRVITPIVVLCYGVWVLASAAVLVIGPRGPAVLVSVAAGLLAVALTAVLAAPTHARLGREGPRPELLVRLLRVDRLRLLAALAALVAALVACVPG